VAWNGTSVHRLSCAVQGIGDSHSINLTKREADKVLSLEDPRLKKLAPRFITNEAGEREEVVFNLQKFAEFWEEIETLLVDEEYELKEDLKVASVVLERARKFDEAQSKGYTQEETEKMFGVSE